MAVPGLARFQGASLDGLKAKALKPSVSEAQRIAIALIDEDPDQPRRTFDQAELDGLAASIRMVGVLQPVGVQPADGGRYLLRWGARRFRASTLAGLTEIPAVLVGENQRGIEAQVIENAQRANNAPLEIAAAIDVMSKREMSNEQIATACNLHPQELKHYRALAEIAQVPGLGEWVNRAPPRALYEVYGAWKKATDSQRGRIENIAGTVEELTLTAARRIIAGLAQDAPSEPIEAEAPEPVSTAPSVGPDPVAPDDAASDDRPARHRSAAHKAAPSEDERERIVRAWLDLPMPRPRLTV